MSAREDVELRNQKQKQKQKKYQNPIKNILEQFPIMILDGAFATELEKCGCQLDDPLWSAKVLMEDPDQIAAVHDMYFKAGADCAITASYQATYEGFMKRGMSEEGARHLIQKSIFIARETRDLFWTEAMQVEGNRPKPLVVASVGPYGAYLADGSEYSGHYGLSKEALMTFHKKRLEALIDAAPDLLGIETIPCLIEAEAVLELLKSYPEMYAWVSFSAKDGQYINSGETIEKCAAWADTLPQIAAIGINCTDPKYIPELISRIKAMTDKPVIVYPNTGESYDPIGKSWHGQHHVTTYSQAAKQWHEDGAKLIGGCCRTSPQDIQEIAMWARGHKKSESK